MEGNIMNEINALFEKIGNGQIDNALKISIAELLLAKIEEKKNAMKNIQTETNKSSL